MNKYPMKSLLPCVRFCAALLVALAGFASSRAADATATGTITGSVSNAATTNLLEGSRVEIVALGLSTLADNTGRYVLTGVPAGTHEVVVSYIGLDTLRRPVTVGAGERACDLSARHPERVREMAAQYDGWAKRVGVLPWPIGSAIKAEAAAKKAAATPK
jgi:hypothetical protein